MRHCLVMTAYKDIENINRIIRCVPADWGVYIHIDKKSSIKASDIISTAHVFKEKKIFWGSWEHLYAFVFLLTKAVGSGIHYDYYHLMTGQDFFACPISEFDAKVGSDGACYMGVFRIPNKYWSWGYGIDIFTYRTLASFGDIRFTPLRYINSCLKYLQKYSGTKKNLPSCELYGGPVYCSLTTEFVQWMLKSPFAINLLDSLKNSTCAEEVYFQTVIMNSPFREKVKIDKTLRYVDWHSSPRPKFLDLSDYDKIITSKSLFCRKIDSGHSKDLIVALMRLQNDRLYK